MFARLTLDPEITLKVRMRKMREIREDDRTAGVTARVTAGVMAGVMEGEETGERGEQRRRRKERRKKNGGDDRCALLTCLYLFLCLCLSLSLSLCLCQAYLKRRMGTKKRRTPWRRE